MPKFLRKFTSALKVGYSVLQKYEGLEQAGLVPELQIKGVPVHVIDEASEAFVASLKKAHDDATTPKTLTFPLVKQ